MKQPDLFGGETDIDLKRKRGWLEVKAIRNYRLADKEGKNCKTCDNLVKKEFANTYYKCQLISIAASASSDIRLKNVCDLWKMN